MNEVWITIVVGGLATYSLRFAFLAAAERVHAVPPRVREALRMIPPAALAALVAPALLRPEDVFDPWNVRLLAGLLALAVAWRTRNLLLTILVGLVGIIALQAAGLTL